MKDKEHTNPSVFISYTHDSQEHLDKVLEFSNTLRSKGIDTILDQYEESPKEGWPRWMDRQIKKADYVIMICTPKYFQRVMGEEEAAVGLGGIWESGLIYQHLYNSGGINNKFIPVIFESGSSYYDIPTPLQGATHYLADDYHSFYKLCLRLRGVATHVNKPNLGDLTPLKEKERKTMFITSIIDIEAWDNAKWLGCGYLLSKHCEHPPTLVILFTNKEASEIIMNQWKKDLSKGKSQIDYYEELRISIVNTDFVGEESGYFVTIGSNLEGTLKRYNNQNIDTNCEESIFFTISRIQYVNETTTLKHTFFDHYEKFGKYFLELAYLENNEMNILKGFSLEKRDINKRHISEVNETDLDAMILPRYKKMLGYT